MSFAAATLNGKIYAVGGIDALGNALSSVEVRREGIVTTARWAYDHAWHEPLLSARASTPLQYLAI